MGQAQNSFERIYEVVKRIPKGKVATYGQIALLAGNPRWARVVGYALHVNPDPQYIRCHRVVNRLGEVSSAFVFGGANRQAELLGAEGVVCENGFVDLTRYQWKPGIDRMYEYCLFDLDGTLTDPGIGITNSVMYALNKYGILVADRSELYKFIGPPLIDSFRQYYGFSIKQAKEAVDYYREYYREKGILENQVYEGIPDVLRQLQKAGHKIVLATSKPEEFAIRILEHFGLIDYFTFVAGANMDETRSKKDEVIDYALSSCHVSDASKAVMIGDREYDILGAGKFGMDSIGVLFGYGSEAELRTAGATYLAATQADILNYI